ncbi:MAG: carbohydrate binding domain-containing protein [Lentisphaeria bacterium]|nr:carbohydrate binding domain-containing protein [Lentisphaeria bacterium]
MKKMVVALLLTAMFLVNAGEVRNILKNGDFRAGMAEWEILGKPIRTETKNGKIALDIQRSSDAGALKLQQIQSALQVGNTYRLYFTVECEKAQTRPMVFSYRMRTKSKNLGLFKQLPLRQGTQKLFIELIPGQNSDDPNDPPIISFYLGELDGKITFSEMLLVDMNKIEYRKPPFSDKWTVFGLIDPAVQVSTSIPDTLPGMNPQKRIEPFVVEVPTNIKSNRINLRLEAGASRKRFRDAAVLYNEFESSGEQFIPVGFGADWWMEITLNGKMIYSTLADGNAKKPVSPANHLVFLPVKKGKNLLAVKVIAGSEGWRLFWGGVQPPPKPQTFTAADGYFPINTRNLAVRKGSALDLSALVDAPAGKYGRAILSPDGHIVFEKKSVPQRFFGFSSGLDDNVWKNSSDKDFPKLISEYARAVRAQGYNLIRMHGFDAWLMAGSTKDMNPLPKYIDRWDRIVWEMKQQGIYLQLNLFAFWLYSSEKDWFQVAEKRMANKVLFIIGEPNLRKRFAQSARMVLNHKNPYTKLAWKDDPVFIAVEYYNELGLGIEYASRMQQFYPEDYRFLKNKWKDFLNRKYADIPQAKRPYNAKILADPPLPVFWDRSQLRVDYDEFWYTNLKETYRFCDQVMKDCGYKGLTLQCPMPALRCAAVSWEGVQIVDAHGYHCHPDGGEQPGAIVDQVSSIANGASLFRYPFGGRIYGRPFFFNEHNYVFRNPYQYEKPVALDAYAALNDWDSLAIHSEAVALSNNQRASSFMAANNPVLRSGEFLSALFFLRRDVTPAKHKVAVALTRDYVFKPGNSAYALSPTQSRISLLTNTASIFTDLPRYSRVPQPQKPDMVFSPAGSAEIVWHGWFAQAKENAVNDPSLESLINAMRRRGILPIGNRTDPGRGIYQSESGEITLYAKEKKVTVITPKSEAVALIAGKREKLGTLEIRKNSVNTLIGLGSVDNKPLKNSKRMVLILSSRIANTNMQHDPTGQYLRVVGTYPILYHCGNYELLIRRKDKLRCWALSLTGERCQELPLIRSANGWLLALDMAKLKNGPTPFFELAEK